MKRALKTIAAMAALAWLLPATPASAQEATIEEALEELQREIERGASSLDHPYLPAVYILRQVTGPRSPAELDAFADRLAAMAADASLPEHVQTNAKIVLGEAANLKSGVRHEGGTPYVRAFDLLVQLYEGGIPDRAGLDANHDYDDNWSLGTILRVDPERGPAYVQGVFERSERPPICPVSPSMIIRESDTTWVVDESGSLVVWDPPPECVRGSRTFHRTTWCEAGYILYKDVVYEAERRTWPGGGIPTSDHEPTPIPDGLPEHVEDWYRRCQ